MLDRKCRIMYIMHFFQEQLADTVLPSADNSKDKLELSEPPQTWAKSVVIDPDGTPSGKKWPTSAHRENTIPSTPGSVFSGQIADNST